MSQDNGVNCSGIMDLSLRKILSEWGQSVQDFFNEVSRPSDTTRGRLSLLMESASKQRRLFYIGLTLLLISVLLLFWEIPGTQMWGGGAYPNLVRLS